MKKKKIYLQTTQIDCAKTIGEIQKLISEYGAEKIMTDYEAGEPYGLSFLMIHEGIRIPYKLPCNWKSIFDDIQEQRKRTSAREKNQFEDLIQARRIAWRHILYWIKAQFAFIGFRQAKIPQVFMAYIVDDKGQTLYEKLEISHFKAIEYKEVKS